VVIDGNDNVTIYIRLFSLPTGQTVIFVSVDRLRGDTDSDDPRAAGAPSPSVVQVSLVSPGSARLAAMAARLTTPALVEGPSGGKSGTVTFLAEPLTTFAGMMSGPGPRAVTFEIPTPSGGRVDIVPIPRADGTWPPSTSERDSSAQGKGEQPPGGQGPAKPLNRLLLEVGPPPSLQADPDEDGEDDFSASDPAEEQGPELTDVVFSSGWLPEITGCCDGPVDDVSTCAV
jgi:hypothetical protein